MEYEPFASVLEGHRLYLPLLQDVTRSGCSWGRLTAAQRRTMEKPIGAWKDAANQDMSRRSYWTSCTTRAEACLRAAKGPRCGFERQPTKNMPMCSSTRARFATKAKACPRATRRRANITGILIFVPCACTNICQNKQTIDLVRSSPAPTYTRAPASAVLKRRLA